MDSSASDPRAAQAERSYASLFRLAERHAASTEARARQVNPHLISPLEAIRLAAMLGGGSASYLPDEPELDTDDLTAALTLVPLARADLDEVELSLLMVARRRGMTWSEVARGLGLGSAQAAQQRHDRLAARESTQG